jgi:hypothetical protein
MKKFLVLLMVLVMASIASATPLMKLGDATAPFTSGSATATLSRSTFDLYVWASSDIMFNSDSDGQGDPDPRTGLDCIQVFLQYDTTKVNLTGGLISNLAAVPGNPYGTTWTGRRQGTYDGLGFCEGALLPSINVDVFPLQKIMKASFTFVDWGSITMLPSVSSTHQSLQGNSVAVGGMYPAIRGEIWAPEPMTIGLLGLGAVLIRRKR